MYKQKQYTEQNNEVVLDFMKAHSFVTLLCNDADGLMQATHIPVLVKTENAELYLEAHVSVHTEHYKALARGNEVLVIFNGPHSYISASWYTNPQHASTWNYIAVHARGTVAFYDENNLRRILKELTDTYEAADTKAAYDNLPEKYIAGLANAIKGFRINIYVLENVFKLSQNRDEVSYNNIIEQLKKTDDNGSNTIATEMEKRKSELFKK